MCQAFSCAADSKHSAWHVHPSQDAFSASTVSSRSHFLLCPKSLTPHSRPSVNLCWASTGRTQVPGRTVLIARRGSWHSPSCKPAWFKVLVLRASWGTPCYACGGVKQRPPKAPIPHPAAYRAGLLSWQLGQQLSPGLCACPSWAPLPLSHPMTQQKVKPELVPAGPGLAVTASLQKHPPRASAWGQAQPSLRPQGSSRPWRCGAHTSSRTVGTPLVSRLSLCSEPPSPMGAQTTLPQSLFFSLLF